MSSSWTQVITNAPRLDSSSLSTILGAPNQFIQVATKNASITAGYRQVDPQGSIAYNPTDQDMYYSDGTVWNLLGGKGGGTAAVTHGDVWIWNGTKWLLASSMAGGNLYLGYNALNTTAEGTTTALAGLRNTALGTSTLIAATAAANDNTSLGYKALILSTSATGNTAIGSLALPVVTTGSNNVAVGYNAGTVNATGSSCVYIGAGIIGSGAGISGEVVVGYGATGKGANTIFLSAPTANLGLFSNALNISGGINTNLVPVSYNTSTGQLAANGSVQTQSFAVTTPLTAPMSGAVVVVPSAAAPVVLTLPTVATTGLTYRIINGSTGPTSTITVTALTAVINGAMTPDNLVAFGAAGALAATGQVTNGTNLIFGTTARKGDWVELTSDGTTWWLRGATSLSSSFTAT
jgi:hypothetical protein